MIGKESQAWLLMLVGAAICLYTANRGRRGVFWNLRNRGEGFVGVMLIAMGIQDHLERLNVDVPFVRWLPLAFGVIGVGLVVAGRLGEPGGDPDDEPERIEDAPSPPSSVVTGGAPRGGADGPPDNREQPAVTRTNQSS